MAFALPCNVRCASAICPVMVIIPEVIYKITKRLNMMGHIFALVLPNLTLIFCKEATHSVVSLFLY